ncbi:MAG: CARDB domain-containing protein, partial [Granulosicoccaceae bacterium]
MNTRHTSVVTALLLFAGVLTGTTATAQPLPDLTITDLRVNQQCQIEVTMKNLGPGALPETAFYVGTKPYLQFYKNNQTAGGWNMGKRALQPAGGTYTFVVQAPNLIVSGSHSYRAVIDEGNIVTEANENNNEMTRTLSCSPPLPDLAITKISFNKDCTARVTLKNIGTANYPNNLFNLVNLSRTIDGAGKGYRKLTDVDPTGKLKVPGGEVTWSDLPDFKATTSVKYQFSGGGLSAEGNAANNSLT